MFSHLFNTYEAVTPPKKMENFILDDLLLKRDEMDTGISEDIETSKQQFSTYLNVSDKLIPLLKQDLKIQQNPELLEHADSIEQDIPQREIKLKSPKEFENAFQKACRINPEIQKYKVFLAKTAKRESGFNSHIQNQAGAPYYGYFQMGKDEIKSTTGLSVQQFRNNPVAQILGACKLYEMNLRTIKRIGVYDLGKKRGYSDDALVAGAWLGGPGGVKRYLLGQGDPSDSHWYGGKGGSSVGKVMNNWMNNK